MKLILYRKHYLALVISMIWASTILTAQDEGLRIQLEKAKYEVKHDNTDNAISIALQGLVNAEEAENPHISTQFNFLLGDIFFTKNNYAKSIEHYVNVIFPTEELGDGDLRDLAAGYNRLGLVYQDMKAFDEAYRCFEKAFGLFDQLNDPAERLNVAITWGSTYNQAGNFEKAAGLFKSLVQELDTYTFHRGTKKRFYEEFLTALSELGFTKEGLDHGLEYDENSGELFEPSATVLNIVCTLYRREGNIAKSVLFGEQAISSQPDNVDFILNLARSLIESDRKDEAEPLIGRAINLSDSKNLHQKRVISRNLLASFHLSNGDTKDADPLLRASEQIGKESGLTNPLHSTYELKVQLNTGRYPDEVVKYQFLLKDLNEKIKKEKRDQELAVQKANNLAASLEQKHRIVLTEDENQKKAIDQALVLREQDQQKVKLLEQQSIIDEQSLEKQKLEAQGIQQNLQITQQLLEARERQSELSQLQTEAQLAALKERERSKELEIVRKQQTILQQQTELQQSEIEAARARQTFLIIIIVVSMLGLMAMIFFIFRLNRSRKVISDQNKDLELQQYELQQAQVELTKMLDKEQQMRRNIQQSHQELKAAQSQLIHAEKMSSLGQLTAGIVHEINNPVNFVKGGIETLSRTITEILELLEKVKEIGSDRDAQKKFQELKTTLDDELEYANEIVPQIVKDMIFGTNRIEDIVNGLRIFSRQSGVKSKVVDLHETVEAALLILRPKAKKIGEIQRDFDDSIGEIECFPGQLNQVIVNLVSNALDAVANDGEIVVSTKDLGDQVRVRVQDNGSGMKNEVLEHIFEPFYTTKDVGKGTGLGLSISYSIIEKHGGKMEVESKEGKGTTFTITLNKTMSKVEEEISVG